MYIRRKLIPFILFLFLSGAFFLYHPLTGHADTSPLDGEDSVSGASIEVCLITPAKSYSYCAKAIEPPVRVFFHSGSSVLQLKKNKDYSLTFENNLSASTSEKPALIHVTGKGAYSGMETSLTFIIDKAAVSHVSVGKIPSQVYTGKEITGLALSVKAGSLYLAEGTDYRADYSDNILPSTKSSPGKVILSFLPESPNFTFASGLSTCSRTFIIRPGQINDLRMTEISFDPSCAVLENGMPIATLSENGVAEPRLIVTYNHEPIDSYVLSYKNNKQAGATGSVTLKGTGCFTGTRSFRFHVGTSDLEQQDYFVSPSGSDQNDGLSPTSPFQSIQTAFNRVGAGDTIYLMEGTYHEAVRLSKSGNRKQGFITIQNYQKGQAILDGTGLGSVFLLDISNTSFVKIQGLTLCNALGDWSAGIYASGCGDSIQILDNTITHIDAVHPLTKGSNPILFAGSSTVYPYTNVVVSGNTVSYCAVGWCEAVSLDGNIAHFRVTDNTVHDIGNIGIAAVGHWKTCKKAILDQARDGYIAGNMVYNCFSPNEDGAAAGIYIDGAADVILERNTVHHTQHGLEVGCEKKGYTADRIIMRNNLSYLNQKGGVYFGGYSTTKAGRVTNSSLTGNTFYQNDTLSTGVGELSLEITDHVVIQNNIFYASHQDIFLTAAFSPRYMKNISMDYNIWFSDHSSGFSSPLGQDTHSVFANPLFKNPGGQDFTLLPASPAIDHGNPNYSPDSSETDLIGNPRVINGRVDCGAFEALK